MKSKNKTYVILLTSLLFFSIIIDIGLAERLKIQANGDYVPGFEIGDYFEYFCTKRDSTELNNTFGANWLTDLGSLFWFTGYSAPSSIGEKTRIQIEDISNGSTFWTFVLDGWNWTSEAFNYSAPIQDDVNYGLPLNASTAIFNPSVWLLALPVDGYIAEIIYTSGYYGIGNGIFYNGTDVGDYQIGWVYDDDTGVVKNWWIKNEAEDIIFEISPPEPPPGEDAISGFDTLIAISSVFLAIGLIYIISIRKKINV